MFYLCSVIIKETEIMLVNYLNIEVDFQEDQNPEMSGASQMQISGDTLRRFWDEFQGTSSGGDVENYLSENDGEFENEFNTYNTDLQILIFSWMFDQEGETFEVEYYGDNLFWLFHDFNHAQKDVVSNEVYVDQWLEEQRIFDALDELQERDMLDEFTEEMLDTIETEFRNRWKHQIDRERIVEMCGFEEYEYEEDEY